MTSRTDTRPIALDVTAVSELNFTTGVQRVLREYLAVNRDSVELIRYDEKARIWRSIPELGALVERPRSGIVARVREFAEKTTGAVIEEAKRPKLRQIFREVPFAGPIYDWLKKARTRHLQAQTVIENYNLRDQPEWVPRDGQTYLILDLPAPRASHALAMEDLFRRPGVKSLVFVHDLFPLSHRHLFDREHHHRARKLHLTYLDAVTQASAIAANSNFTLGQYRDFCKLVVTSTRDKQKQSVVHLPWPRMTPDVRPDSAISDRLFGNAAIKVLLVGQLDQRKNFQVVVRAVKSLISDGVDVRLGILAGYSTLTDTALREALESCTTEQRARITTHGIVTDAELVAMYDAATVVAVPSVAEGFGLPVIESLSRGKRVVAADSSALTELGDLFGSDRVHIAPPNDPAEWASHIVQIAQLPPLKAFPVPKEIPKDWSDFHARIIAAASR
jgi:glycosyltransferase involved in cell wall biosynthesis